MHDTNKMPIPSNMDGRVSEIHQDIQQILGNDDLKELLLTDDEIDILEFPILIKEPKWEIIGKIIIIALLGRLFWFLAEISYFKISPESPAIYWLAFFLCAILFIIFVELPRQFYFLKYNADCIIQQSYLEYRKIHTMTGRKEKTYTKIRYADIYHIDFEYRGKNYYAIAVYFIEFSNNHLFYKHKRLEVKVSRKVKEIQELAILLRSLMESYHKTHNCKAYLPRFNWIKQRKIF